MMHHINELSMLDIKKNIDKRASILYKFDAKLL